jgi:hypothetical protein
MSPGVLTKLQNSQNGNQEFLEQIKACNAVYQMKFLSGEMMALLQL